MHYGTTREAAERQEGSDRCPSALNRRVLSPRTAILVVVVVQVLGERSGLADTVGRDAAANSRSRPPVAVTDASPVARLTGAQPCRMWMRGGMLLVKGQGSGRLAAVPDPAPVNVLDGGGITLVGADGQELEGRLPSPSELQDMGFRNVFPALGLFAQVETPVLLGPDGPVVGRALDGAFVPIQAVDGIRARVSLPWVERATNEHDPADLQRRDELTRSDESFWVSLADLGLDRHPLQAIKRDEIWISRRWRVLRLAAERSSPVFAIARCMPAREVETKVNDGGRAQKLAYRFEGIEILGWAEKPFPDTDPDYRCSRTIVKASTETVHATTVDVPPLPAGFVLAQRFPDQSELPTSIVETFQPGKLLFLPVLQGRRLECAPYRVTKDRRYSRGFVRARPPSANVVRLEYTLGLQSNFLTVFGPSTHYRHGPATYTACAHTLRFVQVHRDRLEMIWGHDEPMAYHPDDLEVWYRDRGMCRQEATFARVSTACQ
jgi:hypothetical protein